jgi:uncharacterized protein YdaU (DUF1376 family)
VSEKSPAFQFYPKDFLSDEKQIRMSLPAVGIYMRLICHCWNEGSLPADAVSLARLSGATGRQIRELWPSIGPCFRTTEDGRLIHPRLEREREKQQVYRRRQSDAGKASATARAASQSVPFPTTVEPRLNHGSSVVALPVEPARVLNSSSSSSVCTLQTSVSQTDTPPLDEAFSHFQRAYPPERRQGGFMAEQAYLAAVEGMGGAQLLLARLEQHKRSEEWAVKKLVPGMQKWLLDELWRRELAEAPGTEDLASKALARIQRDQQRYGGKS